MDEFNAKDKDNDGSLDLSEYCEVVPRDLGKLTDRFPRTCEEKQTSEDYGYREDTVENFAYSMCWRHFLEEVDWNKNCAVNFYEYMYHLGKKPGVGKGDLIWELMRLPEMVRGIKRADKLDIGTVLIGKWLNTIIDRLQWIFI